MYSIHFRLAYKNEGELPNNIVSVDQEWRFCTAEYPTKQVLINHIKDNPRGEKCLELINEFVYLMSLPKIRVVNNWETGTALKYYPIGWMCFIFIFDREINERWHKENKIIVAK